MRGIIFAGGEAPTEGFVRGFIKEGDYIICLDKGLEYADRAGLAPSVILGDFDSVNEELLEKYAAKGIPIKDYPAKKDFTDMELGINHAIQAGVNELILLAAFGGRIDHTLGNIDNLLQAVHKGVKAAIYDEKQHLYVINEGQEFHYKEGSIISLISLSDKVEGITTKNLLYPLEGENLVKGYSRGVSNIFTKDVAVIDFKSGMLQVVVNI
ncbi:MAG: thiamine diphosphokinase [Defluviitaleaceae bacterium]|nr:thiamine diphosphokinase [Defluviitaleaceae bacterium]